MSTSLSGRTISHYRILDKLGEGGMGEVYRAQDTRLEREVALKFLSEERLGGAEEKDRFLLEARAAASLDHPNICTIHEIDEADGQAFISMALVVGETLKDRIAAGRVDLATALDIMIQVAEGLSEAHQGGIVHRDIKPANIMVAADGRAQIMDFGLAKVPGVSSITRTGVTLGTLAYMSPEQARGEAIDARTDIWSLGVVFYELISGRRPFHAEYEHAVLYAVCNEEPESLESLVTGLPVGLIRIMQRCLAKEPIRRYQSVDDLKADLERLKEDEGYYPLPVTRSMETPIRRSSSWAWLLILAVVFLAWGWISLHPSGRHLLDRILGRAVPEQKYLTVLPLANLGGEPDNQALADGLQVYLISKITQLERFRECLWVVPAADIRQSRISSTAEARQVFASTLAVSGSVQRSEGLLRVILNLVDTRTGRQLDSSVLEDREASASVLQLDALRHLVEMLEIELAPEAEAALAGGNTDINYAHELYLMGSGLLQGLEFLPPEDRVETIGNAIDFFKRALHADRGYARAHAGLAHAYMRRGYWEDESGWLDRAVAQCDSAIALDPSLDEAQFTLAETQRLRGDLEAAADTFERLITLNPRYPEATYSLGMVYSEARQDSLAVISYERAIALRPQDWRPHHGLGFHHYNRGNFEGAIDQFKRVIELSPENFYKGYNDLGAIYLYQHRLPEAREMFERSLAIKPTAGTYSNLGSLAHFEGDYEEAARQYYNSVRLYELDYRVWGNLAGALANIPGREPDAKETYRKAAALAEKWRRYRPQESRLLARLISFYCYLEQHDRMLPLQQQLAEMSPNDFEALYQMSQTHEKMGEREKALECIGRALALGYPIEKVKASPVLADLRRDPGWTRLLESLEITNQ